MTVLLLCGHTAWAQSEAGDWQFGIGAGYTNYYGDLSNYRVKGLNNIHRFAAFNKYYQDRPSFTLLAQKKVTPTLGLMIQGNFLQFGMSDRYRNNDGTYDINAANYARSLNFRTTMEDVGLAFSFSPNNGIIGSTKAFFYPSFFVGGGVSHFTVKGDLYDRDNRPYTYQQPGDISDNTYETNLRDLRTETNRRYSNLQPYVDLGLALNFRLSSMLTLALQSDIKYSGSDYLDDVSNKYKTSYATDAERYAARPGYNIVDPVTLQRGDANGVNDFYINNRLVLHISLGSKQATQKSFNPPVIYTLSRSYSSYKPYRRVTDTLIKQDAVSDSLLKRQAFLIDSLKADSSVRATFQAMQVDSFSRKFDTISSQLSEIRQLLYNHQQVPRLRQLEAQMDSIKTLRGRILAKPVISREETLRLRIYDLEQDSLRHEMDKLPKAEKPAIKDTTIALREQYPSSSDTMIQTVTEVETTTETMTPLVGADSVTRVRDSASAAFEKYQLERLAQMNKDSINALKARFRQANDSATYYRNRYAERNGVVQPDTVVKRKWYQRLFSSKKEKKDTVIIAAVPSYQQGNDSLAYNSNGYAGQPVMVQPDTVVKRKWYQRLFSSKKENRDTIAVRRRVRDTAVVQQRVEYAPVLQNGVSVDDADRQRYYEQQVKDLRARIRQRERDSVAALATTRDQDAIAEDRLRQMQNQLNVNADSISYIQSRLQRASDSATYYQQQLTRTQANDANEDVTKQKWYKELFASGSAKRRQQEKLEARQDVYSDQQRNYNQEAANLQYQLTAIQQRNQDLEREAQYLNAYRSQRATSTVIAPPVVIRESDRDYNRSNSRDLSAIRNDVDDLKSQVNRPNNQTTFVPPPVVVTPARPDSLVQTPASTSVTYDSAQIASLRSALNDIRRELDSLRNKPQPLVAAKPAVAEKKYDVSGFPVVSLYFNMGATTPTNDQLNKLAPLSQVAARNTTSIIQLKGFTDAVGNAATNEKIARKRMASVRQLLVDRYRVSSSRIRLEEPEMAERGSAKTANPLDRRVDLLFMPE